MFWHCPLCARIRASLCVLTLLLLYSACAPAPATEAPAALNISPDSMVFPAQVAADQNQQMIQAFLNVSPNIHSSLSQAVQDQNVKSASSFGGLALNFDGSNAVYTQDENQALHLQVIGVPVRWTPDNITTIQTMIAAGATEDLVLGTMHVENSIETGPQKGDYLLIWQAASNTVVMQDILTGIITQESQACEANLNSVFEPSFEFSKGSLGICIPWDDRRCCF